MLCKPTCVRPEWSKQKATWLVWPHNQENWGARLPLIQEFYLNLIETILQFQDVELLVHPASNQTLLQNIQTTHPDGSSFAGQLQRHEFSTNTIWIRDFGPWFLFPQSGSEPQALEFGFNSWGGKFPPFDQDNSTPHFMANLKAWTLRSQSYIFEGGALELNGSGLGLTTQECLHNTNRNSPSQSEELVQIIQDQFELDQLLILPHGLEGDHTDGHIDNVARFIGPRTLLIVDDTSPQSKTRFEENTQYLEEHLPQDIQVIKIPNLEAGEYQGEILPQSLANFIFVNGAIIYPSYGQKEAELQLESILQEQFPDRQIIGIDCQLLIQEGGALHCMSLHQPA